MNEDYPPYADAMRRAHLAVDRLAYACAICGDLLLETSVGVWHNLETRDHGRTACVSLPRTGDDPHLRVEPTHTALALNTPERVLAYLEGRLNDVVRA